MTLLSVAGQSVLTVHITCFLLTRLLVLVEGELAGKEVLFTLVIEGLQEEKEGEGKRKEGHGRGLSNVHMEKIKMMIDLLSALWTPDHTASVWPFKTLYTTVSSSKI